MADDLFGSMKRFVGFGAEDETNLRRIGSVLEPHVEAIVGEFYARIDSDPVARQVVEHASDRLRLERTLAVWLRQCFEGPWDQTYFDRRARIGHRHVEIGLPQHFMLTAMNVVRQQVCGVLVGVDADKQSLRRMFMAVEKLFDLELAIMLHTYREEHSERLYRSVVDGVDAIIVGVDSEGIVRMWNRAAEIATGRPAARAIGHPFATLLSTRAGAESLQESLRTAFEGHGAGPVELSLDTESGRQCIVRWVFGLLDATEGLGPMVAAVGEDMTDRMELERRAAEAEAMASLGTLTAGLAHEIRNPLNAASLQLELLRRGLVKSGEGAVVTGSMHRVDIVEDELKRLSNLLDDFLSLAKPRGLILDAVDLSRLIAEVTEMQQPAAEAAGVQLRAGPGDGPVMARGDHGLLMQVLVNLVLNAVDALAGRSDGYVSLACRAMGDTRVELTVEDNGPGIPPELRGRLFSPFVTSKEAGTGLGLTIVKRVIDRHGGTIHLGNRSGGGTVGRIYLPRFA